nr:uncharacterized protein [uncultured bacterium]
MGNVIRLKRSTSPGRAPTPDQMVQGELALNVADGKVFLKRADNTVVEVGNAPGTMPYDLAGVCLWQGAGLILYRSILARPVIFPSGLAGSVAVMDAPHKKSLILDLRRNGTGFGSMTFRPKNTTATFISWSDLTFDAGDVLTITAGSEHDAALVNGTVVFTLAGVR